MMDWQEVYKCLVAEFPDGPPSEEEVRGQQVEFWADHWLKRWPEHLSVPGFLKAGEKYRVTRQQLFEKARTVRSPEDALELYVWIAGWGTGKSGLSVARSAKVLQTPEVAERLLESYSTIQTLGATESYRRLKSSAEHRIAHLGPAFFTKWMYFSAYDAWAESSLAPLILDRRVAASLGWKSTGWSASEYAEYLNGADQIQRQWAPNQGLHVIEYALFHARNMQSCVTRST